MTVALNTQFTYPQVVIQSAVQFPAGHYVELDDIAFEANGLGRKVVQAQSVTAHGKEFSVGYLNVDGTGYVPIRTAPAPLIWETWIRSLAITRIYFAPCIRPSAELQIVTATWNWWLHSVAPLTRASLL